MENAFEVLKLGFTSTDNVLILTNFDKPLIVHIDASDFGVGVTLLQETYTIERPGAYFSKQLKNAEINYSAGEKDMLAIVCSLDNFSFYLYGKPSRLGRIIVHCHGCSLQRDLCQGSPDGW